MRVSLTARFVSHPAIDFRSRTPAAGRRRLGLPAAAATSYQRPRAARTAPPTVATLRASTTGFTFPSVARHGRVRSRRAPASLDSARPRRA